MEKLCVLLLAFFVGWPFGCARRVTQSPANDIIRNDSKSLASAIIYVQQRGIRLPRNCGGDAAFPQTSECRRALADYKRLLAVRLDVIRENITNVKTTRDETGSPRPYVRRIVEADSLGQPVVKEDPSTGRLRYEPEHPDADS